MQNITNNKQNVFYYYYFAILLHTGAVLTFKTCFGPGHLTPPLLLLVYYGLKPDTNLLRHLLSSVSLEAVL